MLSPQRCTRTTPPPNSSGFRGPSLRVHSCLTYSAFPVVPKLSNLSGVSTSLPQNPSSCPRPSTPPPRRRRPLSLPRSASFATAPAPAPPLGSPLWDSSARLPLPEAAPYPGGADVHHHLLEGRRLLGLTLFLQRDLLTKLTRIEAEAVAEPGPFAPDAPSSPVPSPPPSQYKPRPPPRAPARLFQP